MDRATANSYARALGLLGLLLPLVVVGSIGAFKAADAGSKPEFSFVRLVYTNNPAFSGPASYGWGNWTTDYPEAEMHFLQGVRRLTRVHAGAESKVLRLKDDELFNYPFLYAVEVGRWQLSDEEVQRLREYLLRGGFLMVDDFHGSLEWENFMASMGRVFPDRKVVEIPDDNEVFHVLYDLDHRVQIPNIWGAMTGKTWERDGFTPRWRGIYDDENRLMVAINFNMDLGDAWEHADTPQYPQPLTALAYRFGINYVVYAMTH
jgi:Domain of unknown function (DUF4159)